ncbi:MAG: oligosaccharide flippase family protein [Vicinamibacterales bacterium]
MTSTDAGSPPPDATTHRLVWGTASKYALLGINVTLGLVLMPFTVRHLGTADYGLWMLVASMTYYFQLFDLGYGSGLVRHLSEADGRGDLPRMNRIASTFVVVYAGLGLAALAGIALLIAVVLPRFPGLEPEAVPKAQALLAIMGLRIAIGLPMTVFGAVSTCRQRFALNNTVAIVVALTNAGLTYLVLDAGYGLIALVSSTTTVSIAAYAAYAWTARRAFPELRLAPSAFTGSIVREVTAFSLYLFLIDIAVQLGFNLDNLVVGASMGTSAVAIYAVVLRLAEYQRLLSSQLNGLLFPVVVRFSATGRMEALRRTYLESTRIALTLVLGLTVCVVGFGGPLLRYWMGPTFERGVVPLRILAIAGVVLVAQGPTGNVLLGTGRHRLVAFTSLGEAITNVALSLVLVRVLGLTGVALGTALPVILANTLVLLPAACRALDLAPVTFLRQAASAPLIATVPAIAACALLRTFAPPATLMAVFVQGAVVGAIYLSAFIGLGLTPELRARYLAYLRALQPGTIAPSGARS